MKTSARPNSSRQSGFALVIVLCIVVLLVALAVGFIVRATSERSAASGYHASVLARQLADTVTSLVQGQINAASTQGSDVDWVSQPGMVRTFDTSGNLIKAYKLYSGSNMIATSVNIADDVPAASWATDTALCVDLNAPIEVGGVKNFPILDPTLAISDTTSAPLGYAVNSAPGASTYQPVPMPVRWLYVLQDGTIVNPTGSGKVASIAGETPGNPVIGRVAFWTDDDSCKVNINTASEGTFWDLPRASTNQEYKLGDFQPAQREFQRYPGHPAMTSLSAVLPTMTPDQLYSIVPRVVGGGSVQGTVTATNALIPDGDRLYASVDELVFNTTRNTSPATNSGLTKSQLELAKFFLTARSRAPETNLYNLPRIACWPIFKDMLTDRVTAFDKLIAFCASTGTTGDLKPYYFQREKADSPTSDIAITRNGQLYSYLQTLTAKNVPGFGGNFLAKYDAGATGERDQILTEIFDYIRCTNLHDDLLANGKQFTTYWASTSSAANSIPTGHGWVAPTQYKPSGVMTMGVGRTYTLSELAVGFICNADGNDTALSSNDPAGNKVLGGTALGANEKYIQAILLPEMFSPMLGYVVLCPDIMIKISGLETLTINGTALFPITEGTAKYDWIWPVFDASRWWGGNPSWRFSLYGKGSPARGNIPGDALGGAFVFDPAAQGFRELYPFIGTPIKISTSGGAMTMGTANLKVEIYAKASAAPSSTNLIQTINLRFPGGTFPIPKLVDKSVKKTTQMDAQSFWSYTGTVAVVGTGTSTAQYHGRLYYLGKEVGGTGVIGSASAPAAGSFLLKEYDVVRSLLPAHGDFRLVAGSNDVANDVFAPLATYNDTSVNIASDLGSSSSGVDQGFTGGKYISAITYGSKWIPDIPATASGTNTPESSGDYDNGLGLAMDGPLTNKPDEGATQRIAGRHPYFDNAGEEFVGGKTFFSPNRQIPSPGMFGSLPTGVISKVPWRTLLFRPQDSVTSSKPHFGAASSPRDHLMLDLFWMPVVEPYAISDRFSTAGKINLNYQILPFTYLERSTGIQALLKSEMLTVLPNAKSNSYKANSGAALNEVYRLAIDPTATLSQFKTKFDAGSVFKSASEICDVHIVPQGQSVSSMKTFWDTNALTGDNTRERIYTTLYPRLTTRSNTYTVHFRVQSLKKVPGSVAGTWTEGKDVVSGEYRGSTTLERFIDANNSKIPDYAANPSLIPTMKTLDTFYKWRVVENKQFAP